MNILFLNFLFLFLRSRCLILKTPQNAMAYGVLSLKEDVSTHTWKGCWNGKLSWWVWPELTKGMDSPTANHVITDCDSQAVKHRHMRLTALQCLINNIRFNCSYYVNKLSHLLKMTWISSQRPLIMQVIERVF